MRGDRRKDRWIQSVAVERDEDRCVGRQPIEHPADAALADLAGREEELPAARASSTSAGRAVPTPRIPTCTMRVTWSISDARRIGDE